MIYDTEVFDTELEIDRAYTDYQLLVEDSLSEAAKQRKEILDQVVRKFQERLDEVLAPRIQRGLKLQIVRCKSPIGKLKYRGTTFILRESPYSDEPHWNFDAEGDRTYYDVAPEKLQAYVLTELGKIKHRYQHANQA